MKSGIYIISLLLLFALVSCKRNTPSVRLHKVPALQQLETKIQAWVDSGYYNGAAARVVCNDTLIYQSFHGGYTDTTALHVASAGKWVAAAVIAALVDEGILSWNDQVQKYLPQFTGPKGQATLQQLLSHTAGYPDYQPESKRRDDYQTLQEAVENILPLPADTLPGTKFKYGGLAMQIAGRMAEVATATDWETLFQQKLACPLAMQHSSFVPVSIEPGFNPMLAGGFKTCLRDYMNFLQMIAAAGRYNGKQILSAQAIEIMEADHVGQAIVHQPEYVMNARGYDHNNIYGLGLWREELDANGKATLISSPGWAGAFPWVDRANNTYGFIIAKVNDKASSTGFSSFYQSATLPLIIRKGIQQILIKHPITEQKN